MAALQSVNLLQDWLCKGYWLLAAGKGVKGDDGLPTSDEDVMAESAIDYADALLAELEKTANND